MTSAFELVKNTLPRLIYGQKTWIATRKSLVLTYRSLCFEHLTLRKLMKIKHVLFFIALLGIVGWGPFSFFIPANNESPETRAWIDKEMSIIRSQADNIDSSVLRLSLNAYQKARRLGINNRQILTVIDYSKPSTQRRLWVINLKTNRVLFNTFVTHGKNSGNGATPTSFSNQPGSLKSSLGVFLTERSYVGNNGYSLRLIGLEPGINDNAYRRAIVVHGAWYADSRIIRKYGQLGKSWGCPAVSENLARPVIDTIKERTLVFVYSDTNRRWLRNSNFLAG